MTERDADKICGSRRSNGEPCQRWAGQATEHPGEGPCSRHGGCLPNVETKYRRLRADRYVQEYVTPEYWDTSKDADEILLEDVWRTRAQIVALETKIELDGTLTQTTEGQVRREEASALVDLLHNRQKHLAVVTKAAISAGIKERRMQLEEREADIIVQVIRGALAELGVDETPEIRGAVARHLRAVE